jgi:hypothetical protein
MTETATIDRPTPTANKRRRGIGGPIAPKSVTVSAVALARHLDCNRTYIQKLEAEGVLHRDGDGFPLDASRIAYLRYLRRERQRSPRGEADADFQRAKAELIRLRIQEKQRDLMPVSEFMDMVDQICGIFLTHLGSMPARCSDRDLPLRRRLEGWVYEVRVAVADECERIAEKCGGAELPEFVKSLP